MAYCFVQARKVSVCLVYMARQAVIQEKYSSFLDTLLFNLSVPNVLGNLNYILPWATRL